MGLGWVRRGGGARDLPDTGRRWVWVGSGEGVGPGTFLTQDEGGSGLSSGFLVDLVPRPAASSDSEMLQFKVWRLMKA